MFSLDDRNYIMEKIIPNEIITTQNQQIIKVENEEYSITDWFENVRLSDLILQSSNNQVFAIGQSNTIIFRDYGKAFLHAYSKYNRNIYSEIEIVFIHSIDDLKLCDASDVDAKDYLGEENILNILKNSSTTIYPFAMNNGRALENIDNLYISFEKSDENYFFVNGESILAGTQMIDVWSEEENQYIQKEQRIYKKFALGEMIFTALEKNTLNPRVMLYEKVGDEYFAMLENSKNLTIEIKEGIQSISIDKSEVDLTTMNDVEFVVTIVADIEDLKFDYTDTDSHIDNHLGNINNKEMIIVDKNEIPTENTDGTTATRRRTHRCTHK